MSYEHFCELLVSDARRVEFSCRPYAVMAAELLAKRTGIVSIETRLEQRGFFGDSDIVVAVDVSATGGSTERHVRLWELKAPQCYLLERDQNANRYRPTKDLIKAENQLLHYTYEAQGSDEFQDRFSVNRHEIKAGGIIIGTDDRIANVSSPEQKRDALRSLQVRNRLLYEQVDILLITWDRIKEFLRPPTTS